MYRNIFIYLWKWTNKGQIIVSHCHNHKEQWTQAAVILERWWARSWTPGEMDSKNHMTTWCHKSVGLARWDQSRFCGQCKDDCKGSMVETFSIVSKTYKWFEWFFLMLTNFTACVFFFSTNEMWSRCVRVMTVIFSPWGKNAAWLHLNVFWLCYCYVLSVVEENHKEVKRSFLKPKSKRLSVTKVKSFILFYLFNFHFIISWPKRLNFGNELKHCRQQTNKTFTEASILQLSKNRRERFQRNISPPFTGLIIKCPSANHGSHQERGGLMLTFHLSVTGPTHRDRKHLHL